MRECVCRMSVFCRRLCESVYGRYSSPSPSPTSPSPPSSFTCRVDDEEGRRGCEKGQRVGYPRRGTTFPCTDGHVMQGMGGGRRGSIVVVVVVAVGRG